MAKALTHNVRNDYKGRLDTTSFPFTTANLGTSVCSVNSITSPRISSSVTPTKGQDGYISSDTTKMQDQIKPTNRTNPANDPQVSIQLQEQSMEMAIPATNEAMMLMLQSISAQLTTISTDVKSLKESKKELSDQVAGLEYDVEDAQDRLGSQQKDMRICQDQIELLSSAVGQYESQLHQLQDRVSNLEALAKKLELIIFGIIDEAEEPSRCKDLVVQFFTNKLKIPEESVPPINYAYWKGKGENRPIVVRLQNVNDKRTVYSHVGNLKDVVNQKNKP